jgi:hypothetical protein
MVSGDPEKTEWIAFFAWVQLGNLRNRRSTALLQQKSIHPA